MFSLNLGFSSFLYLFSFSYFFYQSLFPTNYKNPSKNHYYFFYEFIYFKCKFILKKFFFLLFKNLLIILFNNYILLLIKIIKILLLKINEKYLNNYLFNNSYFKIINNFKRRLLNEY